MDDAKLPRGVAAFDADTVEVHFDGACEPARGGGVATWGYVARGGTVFHEDCGLAVRPFSPHATNNVAEYVAATRALEWLSAQGIRGDVTLIGDSQLVVRQMRGEYEVRAEHLKAYHAHLRALAGRFRRVEFRWVPREENQRADELSKIALTDTSIDVERHRPGTPVTVAEEDEGPDLERSGP